ncbi:MAG: hypothetical protein WBQ25_11905, partial [Nitrososphaeraceae archaeon]
PELSTSSRILMHEHDFFIHKLLDYEKALLLVQCITCEASYCLLCGKMSNKDKECFCQSID